MEKILNGTASVLPKTAAEFRDLITRDEKPGDGKKLNARERLTALFDDGTFTEIGAFTVRRRDSEEAPASDLEGVLTGYGSVDGCLVYAFAQDLQRTKGAVSDATADKIERLYRLAVGNGCPVVGCFDSAGADLVSGVRALAAYGRIMKAVGTASGIVPQIAVVNGIAQGASAVIAAMFDFVIVTEDSTLSVNPAFVVGGGKAADSVETGVASFREKTDADSSQIKEELLRALEARRDADFEHGSTGVGPHREEFSVRLSGVSARVYGSQGQQRSAALVLKLAEAALFAEVTGEGPVVLLDDVFSELDPARQQYVVKHFENRQVFITCCDEASVTRLANCDVSVHHIEDLRETRCMKPGNN